MIYMHSTLRAASTSLIQALSQEYKASFAARCAQVWQWYTSHAEGYIPSRAQVKAELGLSDYIITKCLRALERLHLAVLDITRERGKPGCWRVFKQPVQDAPPKNLPPKNCHPKPQDLPPKNCAPLSNKGDKNNNTNNPPPKSPTDEQERARVMVEWFINLYPKKCEATHQRIARSELLKICASMTLPEFRVFIISLAGDTENRAKNCHFWRAEQYRPNVARYVTERIWSAPLEPHRHDAPIGSLRTSQPTTRDLKLSDELSDRSWAF